MPGTSSGPGTTPDRQPEPDLQDLEEILSLALLAGTRVQMSGGYTARVCATMERIATSLGAESAEPSVSSVNVGLTVHRGGWSRTGLKRTAHIGVNFSELTDLSNLSGRAPTLTRAQIADELKAISAKEKFYSPRIILPALGLSCAAFAAIFGADPMGILLAGLGGAAGATLRFIMVSRHYFPSIFCLLAAFVSVSVVIAGSSLTETLEPAQAACVLYLVPGVPLLNGVADLLTGHYLNGLVRLTNATVVVVSSAIGLILALALWGANGA